MSVFEDLSLTALDGAPLPIDAIADRVVLVVNVASRCGLTPQYAGLQAIQGAHAAAGLTVLGVPCNQFGGQEPGSPDDIARFCSATYGVSFPMLAKQDVNGPHRSELYRRLVSSPAGGGTDITWNFEKFLVGRDGAVLQRFSPRTPPDAPELATALQRALAS